MFWKWALSNQTEVFFVGCERTICEDELSPEIIMFWDDFVISLGLSFLEISVGDSWF